MIDAELSALISTELTELGTDNSSPNLIRLYENSDVLVYGESHYVQEFQDFYISQLEYLSLAGYRTIHNELFHCFSWMVNDYVNGRRDSLPEFLLYFDETNLNGIRMFNENVPDSLKFSYKYFDLNHWESNLIRCIDEIEEIIGVQNLFSDIKSSDTNSESYRTDLVSLEENLLNQMNSLISNWGEEWYNRIVEIVSVEKQSLEFRNNGSDELREELMFQNVRNDIQNIDNGKDLVVTGLRHASLSSIDNNGFIPLGLRMKNTNQNISSLFFTAFKGIRKQRFFDSQNLSFNLIESADQDDMIIEIHKQNNLGINLLSLDDNYFKENTIKMSSIGGIYNTQIGHHFDGIIVIPEVTVLNSMSVYDWN